MLPKLTFKVTIPMIALTALVTTTPIKEISTTIISTTKAPVDDDMTRLKVVKVAVGVTFSIVVVLGILVAVLEKLFGCIKACCCDGDGMSSHGL